MLFEYLDLGALIKETIKREEYESIDDVLFVVLKQLATSFSIQAVDKAWVKVKKDLDAEKYYSEVFNLVDENNIQQKIGELTKQ